MTIERYSQASNHRPRPEFLGNEFHDVSFSQVLEFVSGASNSQPFSYIVTPNVHHIVRLQTADEQIRQAYRRATMNVCDSRILAVLARLRGVSLPVIPGSDLFAAIFRTLLLPGDTVCVIGGDSLQKEKLEELAKGVTVLQHIPPMGLLQNEAALQECVTFVAKSRSRFTFIAVGSPQQEILAYRMLDNGNCRGMAFCIGASIDLFTGKEKRAPAWMQKLHLEWLHRLAQNPRKMWRRYLVECVAILPLVVRWRRKDVSKDV